MPVPCLQLQTKSLLQSLRACLSSWAVHSCSEMSSCRSLVHRQCSPATLKQHSVSNKAKTAVFFFFVLSFLSFAGFVFRRQFVNESVVTGHVLSL